jgi:hypothetical protein
MNKYEQYEQEKKQIKDTTWQKYEDKVKNIIKELKI